MMPALHVVSLVANVVTLALVAGALYAVLRGTHLAYRRGVADGAFRPGNPEVRAILEAYRPGPRAGDVPDVSAIAAAAHAKAQPEVGDTPPAQVSPVSPEPSPDRLAPLGIVRDPATGRAIYRAEGRPVIERPAPPPARLRLPVSLAEERARIVYLRLVRDVSSHKGFTMTEAEVKARLGAVSPDGSEGNVYDLLRARQATTRPSPKSNP